MGNLTNLLDLELAQIYPVWDEDTSDERMAVSARFADPYLAIIRDDSSLLLLQADDSGDIDEVEVNEDTAAHKWLSCCLYQDQARIFSPSDATSESSPEGDLCLFLLSSDCRLFVSTLSHQRNCRALRLTNVQIIRLPDQKLLSIVEGVDCTQPILSPEPPRRSTAREPLVEAVVADLGDSSSSYPYLIVRTDSSFS